MNKEIFIYMKRIIIGLIPTIICRSVPKLLDKIEQMLELKMMYLVFLITKH